MSMSAVAKERWACERRIAMIQFCGETAMEPPLRFVRAVVRQGTPYSTRAIAAQWSVVESLPKVHVWVQPNFGMTKCRY